MSVTTSTISRGTGMIASSSTFRPHPGRVIRYLFRQLHDIRHGMEALVYSNHPREAAASSYLAIIHSTAVPMLSSAGAGVGRGSLK